MLNFPNQFWNLARAEAAKRSAAQALAHDVILAALLTGAAFGIRLTLGFIGTNVLIFAVCYPILLLATLLAGLRAGLLTLLFSILTFWYAFVPEYYSFDL